MPRTLCGEDEWLKLYVRGGGRILIQKNTQVSVHQCPVRFGEDGETDCFTSPNTNGLSE